MATFLFVLLHLAALIFNWWALAITIPLHLIYRAIDRLGRGKESDDDAHMRCPNCREKVLRQARQCEHCGGKLSPFKSRWD